MQETAQKQHPHQTHQFLGLNAVICSEAMRQVLWLAERAAKTSAAVLITGESGTGKELIARAIHHHSLRCAKPWVDVSCAALPEHLMESELFGFEKGAFSSADAPKPGMFELAHTGTLFLDEVGELEPKMQVKLLRVLDGAPYYRLGGTRKVSVDVRVVAATNCDLGQAVQSGRFRRDLFHRLSQIHIQLPTLRERREDVIPLAEFFLRQHSADASFSAEAAEVLSGYSWPGNIRELKNAVMRAVVYAEQRLVGISDLPPEIFAAQAPQPRQAVVTQPVVPASSACNLEELERRTIEAAIARTGGHRQRAAQLLGISRRTLTRKLKLYGLEEQALAAS